MCEKPKAPLGGGRNELEVLHKDKDKRLSLPLERPQTSLYLFSDNDNNRQQFENCTTKGVRAVNPLVYWTDNFLWDFIRSEKIPYCQLYDEGFTRLGCIGCPMSRSGQKTEFARYPKFYDQYMRTFDRMLIRRKLDGVDERRATEGLRPMGWNCAQDVMDWYLEERQDENQLIIDGWEV